MRRQGKKDSEGVDEHNQVTEPFDFGGVSPYAPTVTGNRLPPDTPPIAMVRPGSPQAQVPAQPPLIGAYPFLPPAVAQPSDMGEGAVGNMQPSQAGIVRGTLVGSRRLRKIFPALVGLCFVAVQLLLLASFALKIIKLWDATLWVNVLYVLRDVLLWPVQALIHLLPLPFTISEPILTLLAILLYGVVSRIVVRCLKLLLHSRR